MVQKTIGFLKEDEESRTLIKMIKDEDDKTFAMKLLRNTLDSWENNEKKLEERLENWDLERVSLMDKVILSTAMAELDNFPFTLQESSLMNYRDRKSFCYRPFKHFH